MDKKNLTWHIDELINANRGVREALKSRCDELTKRSSIDLTTFDNDDYTPAKAIVYFALLDVAQGLRPLSKEGRAIVKQLGG